MEVRTNGLDRLCSRQGPAMRGMDRIEVHIARHPPRASDPRDGSGILIIPAELFQSHRHILHHGPDATSRAPGMGIPMHLQEFLVRSVHHAWSPLNRSSIWL